MRLTAPFKFFIPFRIAGVKSEINEIQSNFEKFESSNIRGKLAGHIKKEYALIKSKDYLEKLTLPFVQAYVTDYFQVESMGGEPADNTYVCPVAAGQKTIVIVPSGGVNKERIE